MKRSGRPAANHEPCRRAGVRLRRVASVVATAFATGLLTSPAAAHLTDLFNDPALGDLRPSLAPIGPVLARTVASTYPIPSASSNTVFAYDPVTGSYVREAGVPGPLFGERAETLGRREFDVSLAYSHVDLTTINGDPLDHLVSQTMVDGNLITKHFDQPVPLADGRKTSFLPRRVTEDIGVTADIVTPAVTYGITPYLDVNVSLPLVRTSLGLTTESLTPDPRLPQFAVASGQPFPQTYVTTASDAAFGIGDILLRAKYTLHAGEPADVAASLGLSLPTGSSKNLQGTGVTQVEPLLIVSRVIAGRFEPFLNAGIDLDATDVGRSVVVWAVGATAQLWKQLGASLVFLGRNELSRQTDPIALPFFFQINRNDYYDVSIGLRYGFWGNGFLAAGALVPLNRDGLRPDAIPTVQLEYAFGPH